jgi:hypothetical protein
MEKILCPTRGGEESYANQDKAIEIAAERDCEVLFLYVSNVNFLLNLRTPMMVKNIQNDLDDMGEFMLTMAQERAEKQDVKAQICLKRGAFFQALSEVIKEYQIKTIFLGSSGEDKGLTTEDYMSGLVDKLQSEYEDLEIIIALEGQIVRHVGNAPSED